MKYVLFFDSGMGGLSVMAEAIKLRPDENYIYYADNKNLPYGSKSMDAIRELTISAVSEVTKNYPVKAVVIACNTATSASVRALRSLHRDIPIIGIEPAIKPACHANPGGRVAVLATEATLRQPKFLELTEKYKPISEIYPIPCPGLVDFVERCILDGGEVEDFIEKLYHPYKHIKFDALVLGCTHYPFLAKPISKVFGCPNVFDGGKGTAGNALLQTEKGCEGGRVFINSANLPDFEENANKLIQSILQKS